MTVAPCRWLVSFFQRSPPPFFCQVLGHLAVYVLARGNVCLSVGLVGFLLLCSFVPNELHSKKDQEQRSWRSDFDDGEMPMEWITKSVDGSLISSDSQQPNRDKLTLKEYNLNQRLKLIGYFYRKAFKKDGLVSRSIL